MPFISVDDLHTADYASIALCGPEGSGKTLTGLKILRGIVGPRGRIAVIDAESGKSRKFRRFEHFDMQVMKDNFAPAAYVALIQEAEKAKYNALLIDGITPAWAGKGGVLEIKDAAAGKMGDLNAWRKASPEHNRLVDALVYCQCHLVVTMRVKTEFSVEQVTSGDGRTKTRVRKVGTKPIQRDGLLYEVDIVGDFDDEHGLTLTKSRCPELDKATFSMSPFETGLREAERLGQILGHWCATGEGLTKVDFLTQEILRVASEKTGADLETVAMMVEAADGDLATLDGILADLVAS